MNPFEWTADAGLKGCTRPFIVAELSANHNGELERALRTMEAAKNAGADAVKLQTYTADTMTIDHDGPGFVIEGGLWHGRSLYELYQEAATPWDWHEALFAKGRALGLPVFSSPFDAGAVDFLEELGAPAYKIASFEIVDLPLIQRCAATGKPLVISTGMASLGEIDEAVGAAREAGAADIVLLHCVSGYPTPPEEINLSTMAELGRLFDVRVGLSDHTLGTSVSVAAAALGAVMIEKHFTLARADGGPDSAFSLEPDELARLTADCRTAAAAIGRAAIGRAPSEEANARLRRSVYVVEDVAAGEILSARNLRAIRPGYGLPPKAIDDVIGRPAARDLRRGEPLTWAMVAEPDDG